MKGFWKNKGLIAIASGLILLVIFIAYAVNFLSSEKKELQLLREQREEMLSLKQDFIALKQKIGSLETKKDFSHLQGIMEATDDVFSSLGLKGKLKTVKPSGTKEVNGGSEEEADIYIEKVTMNEMVNIFYTIEYSPMVLTMKKATIKKSFENPELLNISLTLSFLRTQ